MNIPGEHELVLTEQTKEYAEWECPVCQRHVKLGMAGDLVILKKGDQSVNHGSASTFPMPELQNIGISKPTLH